MNGIDAILRGAPTEEDKMRALSANLRNQQRAGNLFSMSTLAPLARRGAREASQAGAQARTIGNDRRQSALEKTRRAQQLEDRQERREYDAGLLQQEQERTDAAAELKYKRGLGADAASRQQAIELQRMKDEARVNAAEARSSANKRGGLTSNQIQRNKILMAKEIKPLEDVIVGVNQLDDILQKYSVGGAAEGQDIPGMGVIEGMRGNIGDAYRWFKGDESQNVFRLTQNILTKLIKESAGLAQTKTETANVLRGLGQQDITSESVVLKGLADLKTAIKHDQERIKATYKGPVLDDYNDAYGSSNLESVLDVKLDDRDYSPYYDNKETPVYNSEQEELDAIQRELDEWNNTPEIIVRPGD